MFVPTEHLLSRGKWPTEKIPPAFSWDRSKALRKRAFFHLHCTLNIDLTQWILPLHSNVTAISMLNSLSHYLLYLKPSSFESPYILSWIFEEPEIARGSDANIWVSRIPIRSSFEEMQNGFWRTKHFLFQTPLAPNAHIFVHSPSEFFFCEQKTVSFMNALLIWLPCMSEVNTNIFV